MLDVKFIRENLTAVKTNIHNRKLRADPEKVLQLHEKRSSLVQQLDAQRHERNEHAGKMKGSMDNRNELIAHGRALKDSIAAAEKELHTLEAELRTELERIPNMTHPDAPIGSEEKDNREISRSGTIRRFPFPPRDHIELGALLDIIDFEHAATVSGSKFYYLKNEAVLLEMALIHYAMDILRAEGFDILITPDIAREEIVSNIGFSPRGDESNVYTIEDTDLCLIGTSEITLGAYYAGKTIPAEKLPVKLAGLSHCFRKEAGAAGQFSKGLYRVHQFTKLEMFVYAHPQNSEDILEELQQIEQRIFSGLGIPFRLIDTCTGDLGAPAYRKYDLEAWIPGRGDAGGWGEITSASNCTDYQAHRLKTFYRDDEKRNYVHMLNGTALAVPRAIISILENFQEEDGSVLMPEVLRPWLGFDRIHPPKN
ncbi:MAG: serine--tRNA ligase [Salinispira sp.]